MNKAALFSLSALVAIACAAPTSPSDEPNNGDGDGDDNQMGSGGVVTTTSGGAPQVGSGGAPVVGAGGAPVVGAGGAPVVGAGGAPVVGAGGAPPIGATCMATTFTVTAGNGYTDNGDICGFAWTAKFPPTDATVTIDPPCALGDGTDYSRHPLPEPGALANTLGAWGITNDTSVVVYDAATSAYAARLWWLLRWIGHENVRVLNGGYAAWLRAGLPSEKDCPQPQAAPYRVGEVRSQWVVSTAEIESHLSSGLCLVDVRTEPRFEGREEPIDSVAGHVPGASNYPLASSLDADGRFLPPDLLRPRLRSLLQGSPPEHAIAMCGSGVTACHFLLSMAVAGLPLGRLYAGSWSEWIASPGRPVATCL